MFHWLLIVLLTIMPIFLLRVLFRRSSSGKVLSKEVVGFAKLKLLDFKIKVLMLKKLIYQRYAQLWSWVLGGTQQSFLAWLDPL